MAEEAEVYRYRSYTAEGLRVVSENTAKLVGGSYLVRAWDEAPKPAGPEKPADAVAADIVAGLGLTFRGIDV
jgi:hypothetical protein